MNRMHIITDHRAWLLAGALAAGTAFAQPASTMLTTIDSPHGYADTVARLEKAIDARGLKLFARIDHGAEADKAGLKLRPTQVLVFGNPKGGTPLMQATPSLAIDLPLKALVWQADDGKVRVAVNSGDFYRQRHGLGEEAAKGLADVASLVRGALK